MCLLLTLMAAVAATVAWYACEKRKTYRLGTMWLVDFFFEYFSEGAAYFQQSFSEILNDSLLGLSAVTLGAIAWLAILLVKDPKRVFKQQ